MITESDERLERRNNTTLASVPVIGVARSSLVVHNGLIEAAAGRGVIRWGWRLVLHRRVRVCVCLNMDAAQEGDGFTRTPSNFFPNLRVQPPSLPKLFNFNPIVTLLTPAHKTFYKFNLNFTNKPLLHKISSI